MLDGKAEGRVTGLQPFRHPILGVNERIPTGDRELSLNKTLLERQKRESTPFRQGTAFALSEVVSTECHSGEGRKK